MDHFVQILVHFPADLTRPEKYITHDIKFQQFTFNEQILVGTQNNIKQHKTRICIVNSRDIKPYL